MVINAVKILFLSDNSQLHVEILGKVQLNLNAANATILVGTFARIWSESVPRDFSRLRWSAPAARARRPQQVDIGDATGGGHVRLDDGGMRRRVSLTCSEQPKYAQNKPAL